MSFSKRQVFLYFFYKKNFFVLRNTLIFMCFLIVANIYLWCLNFLVFKQKGSTMKKKKLMSKKKAHKKAKVKKLRKKLRKKVKGKLKTTVAPTTTVAAAK